MVNRDTIRFVLCRPRIATNISAAINFTRDLGFESTCIVSNTKPTRVDVPSDTDWHHTIREATANEFLTVGITRRVGQRRKSSSLSLETFCDYLRRWYIRFNQSGLNTAGVAIVFGNESSGLSDDEIESCNLSVSIPTSVECPSLNLSHAVAVVAYRIAVTLDDLDELNVASLTRVDPGAGAPVEPVLSRVDLESVANNLLDTIARGGYQLRDGPQGLKTYIRDLLARCALTNTEAKYISDLITRVVNG